MKPIGILIIFTGFSVQVLKKDLVAAGLCCIQLFVNSFSQEEALKHLEYAKESASLRGLWLPENCIPDCFTKWKRGRCSLCSSSGTASKCTLWVADSELYLQNTFGTLFPPFFYKCFVCRKPILTLGSHYGGEVWCN
ncbi:hypothetical protein MKX03_007240 [Papaver bracteatum]|nr:hypothetical protein MKX03_007240 [Papaver bracteatum]